MTSSWFDLDSTSKTLNLSLLWFNKRSGFENLAGQVHHLRPGQAQPLNLHHLRPVCTNPVQVQHLMPGQVHPIHFKPAEAHSSTLIHSNTAPFQVHHTSLAAPHRIQVHITTLAAATQIQGRKRKGWSHRDFEGF